MLSFALVISIMVNITLVKLYLLRRNRADETIRIFTELHGDASFERLITVLSAELRRRGVDVKGFYVRNRTTKQFECGLDTIPILERSSLAKAFCLSQPLRLEEGSPVDREVLKKHGEVSLAVIPFLMQHADSCWKTHGCRDKLCRCHGRHQPQCWVESGRNFRGKDVASHEEKIAKCLGCRSFLPVGFFLAKDKRYRKTFRFLNDNFGGLLRASVLYENAVISATQDDLTGLLNKKSLRVELTHHLKLAQRHGHPLSVVMFDIDHFKAFNDTYGHQTGDFILKELGSLISTAVRKTDLVARYGGEEFTIVCPNTEKDHALTLSEKLREHGTLRITISMGLATFPRDDIQTVDEIITKADIALYHSKRTRNAVSAYSLALPSMPRKSAEAQQPMHATKPSTTSRSRRKTARTKVPERIEIPGGRMSSPISLPAAAAEIPDQKNPGDF